MYRFCRSLRSLVNSIVRGHAYRTVGTLEEVSTVGIDLLPHNLSGTAVEFYDCAGQVDYLGMHQTFLTRRALYLLVWDVSKCEGKAGDELDEVLHQNVMRLRFALHLRAPGCSVLLVANKCDSSSGDFVATSKAVEKRVVGLFQQWKRRRDGFKHGLFFLGKVVHRMISPTYDAYQTRHVTEVTLLEQPCCVSCDDGRGLDEIVGRISVHGATSIKVPPAWGLAHEFLRALRNKEAPLRAARTYLGLDRVPHAHSEDVSEASLMTKTSLAERWAGVIQSIEVELRSRSKAERMAVADPGSALEGALWISEFAGQIILFANGDGIILDVVWVSNALKPVLDHKLAAETFTGRLAVMRDELVQNGMLRLDFAKHLWSDRKRRPLAEGGVDALYRVVVTLGIAIPLKTSSSRSDSARDHAGLGGSGPCDMLVIMRLPETCFPEQQDKIDRRMGGIKDSVGKVTLKWRFDSAGPPPGLVERVIASCHAIGIVEMGLCWKYGAVFKSRDMASGGVGERLYKFFIRYDDARGTERRVLDVRMLGPLGDDRVWAALRWIASSVVNLSREWPGVRWEGWPECAEHPEERTYLATAEEVRVGDPLLSDADRMVHRRLCDCCLVEGEVLQLVLKNLGNVVDTKRGSEMCVFAAEVGGTVRAEEKASEPERAPAYERRWALAVDENKSNTEEKRPESRGGTLGSGETAPEEKAPAAAEEAPTVDETAPKREETAPTSTGTAEAKTQEQVDTSQPSSETRREPNESSPQPKYEHRACAWYGQLFDLWEPSAKTTAGGLYTTALGTLLTGLGLLGSGPTGWIVCFALTGFFLLAAGVATVFAVRYKIRIQANPQQGTGVESV